MRFFILLLFISTAVNVHAQIDTSQVFENIETLLEDASQENEESQIFDTVEYLLNNPIKLNTASIKELIQIPFLDFNSAKAIIRHRNLLGGIYSTGQLENIEGVDPGIIEKILPFIKLGDEITKTFLESISEQFKNVSINFRSRFQYDIQEKSGFTNNKYLGTRPKYYNRFLSKISDAIKIGVVLEKDAGENSFSDFSSYHLQINNLGIIKNIILGDYNFEFGQGLAIWSPYSFSKGSDAVNVISRNSRNSYIYTSTDENKFMRGININFDFGGLTIIPFYSNHTIDATIDSTNTITSLVADGYHRTQNELNKKNRAIESIAGISVGYPLSNDTHIGLLYYNNKLNYDLEKSSVIKTGGSNFSFTSISYSTVIDKFYLSGETAYNNLSVASINNIEIFVDKNFSLIFSLRNYPHNYFSLHSNGFSEKSSTQNETGFYTGIFWKTSFGSFNIYYDQYKFPFASSSHNFSAQGNDFLIYYSHQVHTNTFLNVRLKTEIKDQIETINNETVLQKRRATNIRGEIQYKISNKIHLRTRGEFVYLTSIANSPKESGYLFFQDIKLIPFKQLQFQSRIIFFSTNSYNSRLYEFENDLLGVMNNPALYGEGIRWYIIGKYSTKFGLSLSFKYSVLLKPNEIKLGSGDSEIPGNMDNRFSLQMDFGF